MEQTECNSARSASLGAALGDPEVIQVEKPTAATMFSTVLIIPVLLQNPQSRT
jgi:hypothetical protein